jgi:hypothetical protein
MGGGYQTALDLPGAQDLIETKGRGIDRQLALMHSLAVSLFAQFTGGSGGGGGGGGGGAPSEGGAYGGFGGGAFDEEQGEGEGGCGFGGEAAAGGWEVALSDGESGGDE